MTTPCCSSASAAIARSGTGFRRISTISRPWTGFRPLVGRVPRRMNFATDVLEAAPAGERALVENGRDGDRKEWRFGEVAGAAVWELPGSRLTQRMV